MDPGAPEAWELSLALGCFGEQKEERRAALGMETKDGGV